MSVTLLYFSPTRSSKKIGETVAETLAHQLDESFSSVSATLPAERLRAPRLANSVIVCAFPVYGGRLPRPFASFLETLACENCRAIPIAVYGNRAFEDALLEAADLLKAGGASVIAAVAAVAQHTFDAAIAAGRPDEADKRALEDFARRIAAKIESGAAQAPAIPGNSPYRDFSPAAQVLPLTDDKCDFCGICANACPTGAIDGTDEHIVNPGCILCAACVKFCPRKAKSLPAPFLQKVWHMLAQTAAQPKQPQLFL